MSISIVTAEGLQKSLCGLLANTRVFRVGTSNTDFCVEVEGEATTIAFNLVVNLIDVNYSVDGVTLSDIKVKVNNVLLDYISGTPFRFVDLREIASGLIVDCKPIADRGVVGKTELHELATAMTQVIQSASISQYYSFRGFAISFD